MKLFATSGCLLLVLLLGVAQAQQLACDRGTRGGNADRQTVTFQCRVTIPRGNSATVTPDWRRFLTAATRFDSTRLTVNSPTPGETRVKVAGTFQGANGNNIKTCQTRRGLILAGGAPAITVGVGPAAAAATIMYDSDEHYKGDSEHYKGDSEHYKHSGEYKKHYDEDSDSYKPMPPAPFTGEVVIFSPIVIAPPAAPVAAPAPKSRKYGDDKYEEDKYEDEDKYEEEYYYNEEDASYYSAKFDDWEEAATEQDASLANFGNDQRQCTPRVRGAQASIASLAPQQNNRQPETPRALRLVVKCKSGPNGQNANQCVVQLQLVASFTGGFVPGVL